jgi:hypothetical protein
MQDVTLLIQGNLSQESYNYYVENYPQLPIVFSVWSYHSTNTSYLPHNVTLLQKRIPIDADYDYINCKLNIVNTGFDLVKTPYVIKLSGEEYFNIEEIINQIKKYPTKIHTSPIDFKHPKDKPFHISDNIIGGKTEDIKLMYNVAKHFYENKSIYIDEDATTEMYLCKSYLIAKYKEHFNENNIVSYLIDNFSILDLETLKPYKLISNRYNYYWHNNFNPYTNKSLKSIEEVALKENPPYIL